MRYKHSERDRSAIYSDALPLFTSGRARLLDNPKLVMQIANLERRTASGGRDRIDHPERGHDDLSNSACGALALLSCGALNTGFIDYYADLAGRAHADDPGAPAPGEEMVRLLAPAGVGSVQTWSGRHLIVPADRVIEVSERDAKPFLRSGWSRFDPGTRGGAVHFG